MTSHWNKYKKVVLCFHQTEKYNHDQCQTRFSEFLTENKNIITDIHHKFDFGTQFQGYHVNIYVKCKSWNNLRKYTQKNPTDSRFFLYINDLTDINDTATWLSYMHMRHKLNYLPQLQNENLSF